MKMRVWKKNDRWVNHCPVCDKHPYAFPIPWTSFALALNDTLKHVAGHKNAASVKEERTL